MPEHLGHRAAGPQRLLLLLIDYPNVESEKNIHTDFATEIARSGQEVVVVAPAFDGQTRLTREGTVDILRVRSRPIFNTNLITKGLSTIQLPKVFSRAITEHLPEWQADWIVSPTPPVTLAPTVRLLKKKWGAKFYLILRDIFPQNAIDIGLMSKGLIHRYFRMQEERTYRLADLIGCMSEGNRRYLIEHNPTLDAQKLRILPNWTSSRVTGDLDKAEKRQVRADWGVKDGDLFCVYGGNLGKPQQVGFLLEAITALKGDPSYRFLIAGRGTESGRFASEIADRGLDNVTLIPRLPRDQYDHILQSADVGLVTLHKDFTIPNIPSRTVGYWAAGLPVLAATDRNTDLPSAFLQRHQAGRWVEMGDLDAFIAELAWFRDNPEDAARLGANGKQAVADHYSSREVVSMFLQQLQED